MSIDLTSLIALQGMIENSTRIIRNKRVLLDIEVAALYQVDINYLRAQVKKEKARFPKDFMFQLTKEEQDKISKYAKLKQLPYVFTESGIMMVGGVLNTKKAIEIHIQVIEHFVQLFKEAMQVNEFINLNIERKESKEIFTILQKMLK
jgi:phage regulator Rha-like protein